MEKKTQSKTKNKNVHKSERISLDLPANPPALMDDKLMEVIITMGSSGEFEARRIADCVSKRCGFAEGDIDIYRSLDTLRALGAVKNDDKISYMRGSPRKVYTLTALGFQYYRKCVLGRDGIESEPRPSLFYTSKRPEAEAVLRFVRDKLEAVGYEVVDQSIQAHIGIMVKIYDQTLPISLEYKNRPDEDVQKTIRTLIDLNEPVFVICQNAHISERIIDNVKALIHERYGAMTSIYKFQKQFGGTVSIITLAKFTKRKKWPLSEDA